MSVIRVERKTTYDIDRVGTNQNARRRARSKHAKVEQSAGTHPSTNIKQEVLMI